MKNWRLVLEKFGKIEKADIEISPFTLFIGDNNSGKSYLMSMIYGIMQIKLDINDYSINRESESYKKIIKWLQSIEKGEKTFEIGIEEREFELLINIFNEILMTNKKTFINSIFNTEIELEKINVSIPYNNNLRIVKLVSKTLIEGIGKNNKGGIDITSKREKEIEILFVERDGKGKLKGGLRFPIDIFQKYDFIILKILEQIIKRNCFDDTNKESCYLPTSRTGFLLTYKTLVQGSLDDKFNAGETRKNLLTRPCSEFLTNISSVSKEDLVEEYKDIVDFIEENIIGGKVEIVEAPISDFRYIPNGSNNSLPMFISSGVITEMTPLLLFLKYKKNLSTLMMEEPEMCLHPKLQWLISRVLIQIVNTDTQVIITTHSDIILQHINNIIKLLKNSNKNKLITEYGYKKNDLIDVEKIRVYQLDSSECKTSIKNLKCGEFGFEVPTFNDMLNDLLEQSRVFEE